MSNVKPLTEHELDTLRTQSFGSTLERHRLIATIYAERMARERVERVGKSLAESGERLHRERDEVFAKLERTQDCHPGNGVNRCNACITCLNHLVTAAEADNVRLTAKGAAMREALVWADKCFETLLEAGLIYDCDETTKNRAPIRAALAESEAES